MNKKTFQLHVINWYQNNKRILPWREDSSPYRVWISEIMLQQTRVEAVIPFFNRFIEKLPTIKDVAEADEDYLNKLWEGLGYYTRIRNIKKAANIILNEHNGMFPSNYDEIISLPGIGPYTGGAISSIAFHQKYSAVDGNVLRVFARVYGIKDNIKDPKTKQSIKSKVESLLPNESISEFNQGLMEIGAKICIPNGAPKCFACPLQKLCKVYKDNTQKDIPVILRKNKKRVENKTVLIFKYKNTYSIMKRPDKGLLANFYQFPLLDDFYSYEDISSQYLVQETLPDSKHIFTHIIWNMKGYLIEVDKKNDDYIFATKEEMRNIYAIPNAFKIYKTYLNI